MPVITLDELPPEALDTLDLIESDGPFPFERDGITFQNRERLLPQKSRGYYREYTVITPWENDRGARRIIAGANGELYYTDDHYESFYWIVTQ
jgi:ribonuclease T1